MDIRDLSAGTVLYLPVAVPGALFSTGTPTRRRATGRSAAPRSRARWSSPSPSTSSRGRTSAFPRYETPGPVSRHFDGKGYHVTTGIGPDLFEGTRAAVSAMIDLLGTLHGLAAVDAYLLCSVCADLRISEVVDQPNWVVSFYFPKVVFD